MPSLVQLFSVLSVLLGASFAAPTPSHNATTIERRTADSPKGVYAHFMVGYAYTYTPSTWTTNIQAAQAGGLDGFVLNVGVDTWQPARVADAYAAAQALGNGFKLFISLDMTSLPCAQTSDADLIRKYVNDYVNHPNQLYYKGQHVLSTFAGENCKFGQADFNSGWNYAIRNGAFDNIAFIPSFFVDPATFGGITAMNGIFNWNSAWTETSSDISFDTDQTYITDVGNRYYIAGVSPSFFTHYGVDSFNKNWIYRSDDWMWSTRWEQLIANRDKIDFVEIVTWNDYSESSYVGPLNADQPKSQAWTTGFDHQDFLKLGMYYITAWKTGSYPAITNNQIFLSSRSHSKNAVATNDPVGQPTNYQWTDDNIYAVVLAQEAGTLQLSIGGSQSTFDITPGVNKVKMPFVAGTPHATFLSCSGATLVDFSPSGMVITDRPATYNYNYYMFASP